MLCPLIAIMARQELLEAQIKTLYQFNSGQVDSISNGNSEIFPKYAMSVQVEKVEEASFGRDAFGRIPESEPLNIC